MTSANASRSSSSFASAGIGNENGIPAFSSGTGVAVPSGGAGRAVVVAAVAAASDGAPWPGARSMGISRPGPSQHQGTNRFLQDEKQKSPERPDRSSPSAYSARSQTPSPPNHVD